MWTLQNIDALKSSPENVQARGFKPDAHVPGGYVVTFTFDDGTDSEMVSTVLSSYDDLKKSAKNMLKRLNDRDQVLSATAETLDLSDPAPKQPDPVDVAEQEYREAVALYEDLKQRAEIDSATYAWGRDNQRVIVQQKLQAWTNLK